MLLSHLRKFGDVMYKRSNFYFFPARPKDCLRTLVLAKWMQFADEE